jgi:hypothetical protein
MVVLGVFSVFWAGFSSQSSNNIFGKFNFSKLLW